MSHGGVILSDEKDGGVLNLSATSTAGGDAGTGVAFDYTAESLVCHDSPSGTCGFLYTAPSPSPIAPSCSVRLIADSGGRASGSGNNGSLVSAARYPTVVGKGRRLQWGGGGSSSSTSGGSSSSIPIRRQPEPAVEGQVFPATTAVAIGATCTASSPASRRSAIRHEQQPVVPPRPAALADTPRDTPTAEGALLCRALSVFGKEPNAEVLTPPRVVGGARAAAAAGGGGRGDGLFITLLDNISLSQILPSQGTQGGTAGTKEEHVIGGRDAADRSGSGCSENKPVSPTGGGGGGTPSAEEEIGARQRRVDSSVAASSRSGADPSQEGGLWNRSRLGLLGSLALQDSEEDDADLNLGAHDAPSRLTPTVHCSPDGESRDKQQEHHRQQSLTPQHPCLAEAETSGKIGPALTPAARGDADSSSVSPLLLPLPPARPVATNPGPAASMAATSSADTAAKDTGNCVETAPPERHAAEALPTAAASPLLRGTSSAQHRRSDAGLSSTLGPLDAPSAAVAAAAGAAVAVGGDAQLAAAAAAAADGQVSSEKGPAAAGGDASAGLESSGAAGVAVAGREVTEGGVDGNRREGSPAVSTVSSFNLDLSLTPECRRMAAAGATKPPMAQPSVRDSTDSCLSSLCLDLPSSVPPSSSKRGSAAHTMSPPSGGLMGQTAADAAADAAPHPREDSAAQSRSGSTRGDNIGSCSSHGRNSVAESDSPWSLRALSSEELSPVSPYQGRRRSPAAAPTSVPPDPPSSTRNSIGAIEKGDRTRGGQEGTPRAVAAIPLVDRDDHACGSTPRRDRVGGRRRAGRFCASTVSGETPGGGREKGVASCPRPWEGGVSCTAGGSAPALAAHGAEGGEGKLPGPGVDEEDEEETEDVSPNTTAAVAASAVVATPRVGFPAGTDAVKAWGVAGDLGDLDAREVDGSRSDGLASSGAAGMGHAEGTVALSGSGSTGSGGGGGGCSTRVDSRSGEVAAIPTGPSVRSEAVSAITHPVVRSVGAGLMTGAAAGSTPSQNRGRRRSSSVEKVYFTDGAAAKKRTNWAAGVCGRGELLSYPGELETSKKAVEAGSVGNDTARGEEEVSTAGEGGPAADPEGRESEGLAREGGLGKAAAAAEGESGRPPHRSPRSAAKGPRRGTLSSTSAQQLVFTSEEDEGGGSSAAGNNARDSSLATDPSPVKFLATPPPSASVAVDRCGEGPSLVPSKEAGPHARLREPPPCELRAGNGAGEASKDKAGRGGGGNNAPDGRQRGDGGAAAATSLPPRVPAAAAAADKVDGLPGHRLSRLGLSTDAPHTSGEDVTGALVSVTAGGAKCGNGDGAPPPRSATWAGKRKARLPSKEAGAASAATSIATATAAAASPAASVPARPSAGGWFSSRRVGAGSGIDDDDSPSTPCSSSVGAGGTATESPDLLLLAASQSAVSGGRDPAKNSGGADPVLGPCSLGAGGRRASCGGARRGGGSGRGEGGAAAMSRSTSAPSRCGGRVSTAVGGTAVDAGGVRSRIGGLLEVTKSSGRRDAARGGKGAAGVVGDTLRRGRRSGRRALAVEDPAGTFPLPALEVISPDEIETTPPVPAPKKRLKARKLAAAAAAATAAVECKPAAAKSTPPAIPDSRGEDRGGGEEDGPGGAGERGRGGTLEEGEERGDVVEGEEHGSNFEGDGEEDEGLAEEEGQGGRVEEHEKGDEEREEEKDAAEEDQAREEREEEEKGQELLERAVEMEEEEEEEDHEKREVAEEEQECAEREEEEEEEGDESATLTDTDIDTETETEEPAAAALAPADEDRPRRHESQPCGEHQRGVVAEGPGGAAASATASPTATGAPRVGLGLGGRGASAPSSEGGSSMVGVGPSAAALSSTRSREALPRPPVQCAGGLFYFWHQARVQQRLARRRRERAHASWLGARVRWNKARKRRGTKLLALLQRAKSTGAPLGGIVRKLSELRSLQFRHDPRHDPDARERQTRVPAASRMAAEEERAWVRRIFSDLRRSVSAGVGGGSEAPSSPSTSRGGGSGGGNGSGGGGGGSGGGGSGGSVDAGLSAPVAEGRGRLTRSGTPELRQGSSSAPTPSQVPGPSLVPVHGWRRRRPATGGGEDATCIHPTAKRRASARTSAAATSSVGLGPVAGLPGTDEGGRSGDDNAHRQATAAAAAAGVAGATAKAVKPALAEVYLSPARVKSPISRCYKAAASSSSGQRHRRHLQRASTVPSPTRTVTLASVISAEVVSVGAAAGAISPTSRAHAADSRRSSSIAVGGGGNGGGAVVPETRDCTRDRCQKPTADQLNDPVFRGRMMARTRAAKAAAAAATACIGGNPASGNCGGSALTGARCQPDRRIHRAGWVDDVGRGLQGKRGGGGGVEQRQATGFNGWMSSRRQDWGLDDVGLPAEQSRGVGSAAPSASSRRLSRSKTAPSPSKSGGGAASPPPPPPASAARAKPTAERLTGPSLGGKSGEARASSAVGFAGGRGAKRGADGGSSGGGDGGSGCHGGTWPRSVGVGPRSHAKKKSRGNKEGVGEDAGAVEAIPAVPAAAVGPADSTRADKTSTSSPSPMQRQKTSESGRFHEVSHEGGRGVPATKSCRQQRAISSAASVAVSHVRCAARQHHRSRGPRGEKMLRQASVQATGTAATAPTPTAENVRDFPAAAAGRSGPFAGLSLVLVALPDDVHRGVERTIVAGGGRVLEDMPPPKTRGGLVLRPPAAGAKAAAAAAGASRPGRKRDKVTAAAAAEEKEDVVVVVSVPSASRLPRYVLAIATGTPLLHHLWVSDSAAEARPLPASPYLLPGAREASWRRQAAFSAGTAAVGTTVAASKAGGSDKASRAALARAVLKTGTPLMGMAIGVAHPSPTTCERWAQVLRAAGAQTVLRITGNPLIVLLPLREETAAGTASSPSRGTRSCRRGRRTAGASSSSSSSLQAGQLAGLDCVLCDFPGAWDGSSGGDDSECRAATGRRPGGGNGGVPALAGTTTTKATNSPPPFSSLGLVFEAAKLEGVPVVALSWAMDCVVRGTRVRQQARPEYLTPFLDASAAAARPSSRSHSLAGGTSTRLLVAVSHSGTRYEVSDHVYFSAAGRGRGGGGCTGGGGSGGPNGGHERRQQEAAVGRIVHLERAGGSGGRVLATIEPLQIHDNTRAVVRPLGDSGGRADGGGSGALGGGVLHVVVRGGGGYFASPSADSSVSRGRARRARELKKVVLAEKGGTTTAANTRTPGRQNWQKMEASDAFLLGRVSVLSAREFDSRRGYCGRDPDVYVQQQRVATARGSPNLRTAK